MNKPTLGFLILVVALIFGIAISNSDSTQPVWQKSFPGGFQTLPVVIDGFIFALLDQKTIVKFDSKGEIIAKAELKGISKYPLLSPASSVVAADPVFGVEGYSSENLKLSWARQIPLAGDFFPLSLPEERFLVQTASGSIVSLDGKTGSSAWEADLPGKIVQCDAGQVISCLIKVTEEKKQVFKLISIDPGEGKILWTFPLPVDSGSFHFIRNCIVFCLENGTPVIADQKSGETKYLHSIEGMRIAKIVGTHLLMLGVGGSRIEVLNLANGKSWSSTLSSPLVCAWGDNTNIGIVDGTGIRVVRADTGLTSWQRDLGKVFSATDFDGGVCVNYSAGGILGGVNFEFFTTRNGNPVWICSDAAVFLQPLPSSGGELVFCRNGNVRMISRVSAAPVENQVNQPVSNKPPPGDLSSEILSSPLFNKDPIPATSSK